MMKLSIVMTAYQAEETIKRAIMSVVSQTFKDWELIIVDDCSTDNTGMIADEYAITYDNIRVIHNAKNEGAGMSRRKGIENARGEYVATLDSDDWIEDSHFEHLICAAEEKQADVAWSGITVHYQNGKILSETPRPFQGHGLHILREFFGQGTMCMNNMVIRRKLFDEMPYSSRRYVEDTPTIIPILFLAGRVVTSPTATYHYVQLDSSLCHQASQWKTSLFCGLCILDVWDWFCNRSCKYMCDELNLYAQLEREFKKVFSYDITPEEAKAYYREWAEFTLRSSCLLKVETVSHKK